MSGTRSKRERQARLRRPKAEVHLDQLTHVASKVAALDFHEVPAGPVPQLAVGWLRAAMDQVSVIVLASRKGIGHAVSPNRRSLVELLIRLDWLLAMRQEERGQAVDALIAVEKDQATKHQKHLAEMSTDPKDIPTFEALLSLDIETLSGKLKHEAGALTSAAKAADSYGLFRAWYEETQMTHATVKLGLPYAPSITPGNLGLGKPRVADPDHGTLLLLCLSAVATVFRILVDEGLEPESASLLIDAYFAGINAGL